MSVLFVCLYHLFEHKFRLCISGDSLVCLPVPLVRTFIHTFGHLSVNICFNFKKTISGIKFKILQEVMFGDLDLWPWVPDNLTILSIEVPYFNFRGLFGLWFDEDLYHGRSNKCETFNNDILTETEDFVLKAFEAWAFIWDWDEGEILGLRSDNYKLSPQCCDLEGTLASVNPGTWLVWLYWN